MVQIVVRLPENRNEVGTIEVLDDHGHTVMPAKDVLGQSDKSTAETNGNPTRDPLKQYGQTPTGEYDIVRAIETGFGTRYSTRSYGMFGALVLNPTGGQAKESKTKGQRSGLFIHAGALGAGDRLRPTHGCLRVSNATMRELLRSLARLQMGVRPLMCSILNVKLKVSGSVASDERPSDDEADPPSGFAQCLSGHPHNWNNRPLVYVGAEFKAPFIGIPLGVRITQENYEKLESGLARAPANPGVPPPPSGPTNPQPNPRHGGEHRDPPGYSPGPKPGSESKPEPQAKPEPGPRSEPKPKPEAGPKYEPGPKLPRPP